MSKKAKVGLLAAGAFLSICLIFAVALPREPRYKGLTMAEWLNRSRWFRARGDAQAEEALLALGTNNLPLLVKRLNYDPEKDLYARFFFLIDRLTHFRWAYDIASRRSILSEDSIEVLYQLGPKAAPAIPLLAETVEHGRGNRLTALHVLARTGREGLAVVSSQASTNGDVDIRLSAVHLLDDATQSRVAFIGLTNALNDSDPRVRQLAVSAISNHLQWNPNLAPTERSQLRRRIQE